MVAFWKEVAAKVGFLIVLHIFFTYSYLVYLARHHTTLEHRG